MKCLNKYFRFFCLLIPLIGFSVTYGQISADFSVSSTSGCSPLTVSFKDLSSGNPTEWVWDFGNGITSTLQNPSVTYINGGNYTVRLIVKNLSSANYIEKDNYITVNATPAVEFSLNKDSGCLPVVINFSNNTNLFGAAIKSWLWNYGDGKTSNQQNAAHSYTATGIYDVKLIAQTSAGCSDTLSITGAVRAGIKPSKVSFKATPLDGCASAFRNFTDLSSGVNGWIWDFGDGSKASVKNPSHHYNDTGLFSIKLTASNNGCADSIEHDDYVHVNGPVAKVFQNSSCIDIYKINFLDRSIGAKKWQWNFGDGQTSDLQFPIHIYNKIGGYTAKLIVTTGACSDSTNYPIYIVNEKPSYKATPSKNSYCRNDTIQFSVINYTDSLTFGFSWSFDNGLTKTNFSKNYDTIQHVYTQTGNYPSPILYTSNKHYCYDTAAVVPIDIHGSVAGFKYSSPACTQNDVTFFDQSIPFKNTSIKQWKWNFGDGDSVITADSKTNYAYSFPGLYTTLLKITDADGCTDTISHSIYINKNPVVNAGNDTTICAGMPITLKPTGATSYTWGANAFLSCTNCSNPVATALHNTVFYVTGYNKEGCSNKDTLNINVHEKQALTVQPVDSAICIGATIQFLASGYNSYTWQPATGLNNSNIANPIAAPLNSTVYTVTATDKFNCFSSSANVSIVVNPKPLVNIIDTAVILQPGESYKINATYSNDVVKWNWQPSLWLDNASTATPVAQPQQFIKYKVTASTQNGCVSTDSISLFVACFSSSIFIPNTFSPNGDGVNDYFYPRSRSNVNIKMLKIFNRWGQAVYERYNFPSNNQSAGWNGRFQNNPQKDDTYIYVMQVDCLNGNVFIKKGSISLLR